MLEGLEDAEAQLSETTLAPRGTLKVSMPVWMATPSFAHMIVTNHADNTDVVLDFDLSGQKTNMVEEGFDLALRVAASLDSGMIQKKLAMIEFSRVTVPAFLDRVGRLKAVDDLHGAPFLIYSQIGSSGRICFSAHGDLSDIHYTLVLQSGNERLFHLAAREGMGFAFLPHWLAADNLASGAPEAVLPEEAWLNVPLSAIYPDRSYLPAKMCSFLDFSVGPQRTAHSRKAAPLTTERA